MTSTLALSMLISRILGVVKALDVPMPKGIPCRLLGLEIGSMFDSRGVFCYGSTSEFGVKDSH